MSNSTNILFSERIFLTEGQTELRVLPSIIEKVTNKTLGLHKSALIQQGGVSSTRKCMMVLDVMDLPTKAIVDFDYAFKLAVADGYLQANDPDILACHQLMGQLAPIHGINLEADGWPRKGGTLNAAQAFALLAADATIQPNIDALHTKLLAHNIWVWKKGAIENHLGLPSKSEQAWANFVTQLKIGTVENTITDHVGVEACVTWLFN